MVEEAKKAALPRDVESLVRLVSITADQLQRNMDALCSVQRKLRDLGDENTEARMCLSWSAPTEVGVRTVLTPLDYVEDAELQLVLEVFSKVHAKAVAAAAVDLVEISAALQAALQPKEVTRA